MNRISPILAFALLLPWSAFAQDAAPPQAEAAEQAPPPATGPDGHAYILITGGTSARLPLALPLCLEGEGATRDMTRELWEVVRRDLEISGYFDLLDPDAFIESAGKGIRTGEFDFGDWRVPGAVGLVKARCEQRGAATLVDLHVYDVDAGVQILGRTETAAAGMRVMGHRVANAIIEAFTGKPGVFGSSIVTVANFGQGKEIYVLDADGANRRGVSRNGSINLSPAWSPDGTRIAYTSYRDNNPDVWVTDLRSGRHKKVSAFPGINAGAEWSPDGSQIALTLSKDGDSDIYAIDEGGSILRRMTRDWGIDVSPTWSPDGSKVAFASGRNGNPQIFVMNADGSAVQQLTRLGGHNVAPAWSPDGTRIAFAGRDKGRFDIFVINVDGSGLRRLTQSDGDDEDPSWSPDGNHVLFCSSRDGRGKQLYVMTADGNAQTRITDGKGSYSNPQWGPLPGR